MLLSPHTAGRTTTPEAIIWQAAEWHSRRLGKIGIASSNAAWKHDDLMREVRHAHEAPKREALARLAALNASYGDVWIEKPIQPCFALGL